MIQLPGTVVRIIAVLRLLSQVTMQTLSGGRQPTCAAIRDNRPGSPESQDWNRGERIRHVGESASPYADLTRRAWGECPGDLTGTV